MLDKTAATSSAAPAVPRTMEEALDPAWLTAALAPISGGARVVSVELTDVLKTMASKARVAIRFENEPKRVHAFCLKAFLDDEINMGGPTTIREADFYSEIAPQLTMRTPRCPVVVLDRVTQNGILIMEDLIAAGARFCSALEPFTPDLAAQSLDQLARLHVATRLLPSLPWLPSRIDTIAEHPHFTDTRQQQLLDDPRSEGLSERTRSAVLLHAGLKALAARNAPRQRTILHGDCHAGNLYLTADGPGFTDWQLVQRGHWAQDVAYHMCAILPVEVAEREERRLLDHYLDAVRKLGGAAPDRETAWEDYRCAQVYGFYHWAIAQRVEAPIIKIFIRRLGAGVTRHDTYSLLGL